MLLCTVHPVEEFVRRRLGSFGGEGRRHVSELIPAVSGHVTPPTYPLHIINSLTIYTHAPALIRSYCLKS
jgi:hypothetical protein